MENNKIENKASYDALFHLIFLLGGAVLAFAGLVLITLKLFGYPLLFEGVISIFVGLIAIYMTKIYTLLINVLDSFTNVLNSASDEISKRYDNGRMYNQGMYHPGMKTININDAMSPEQLDEMKKQFPHLASLLDSVTDLGEQRNPVKTKDLTKLSLTELEKRLAHAVKDEDFDEAILLRNEIAKRK